MCTLGAANLGLHLLGPFMSMEKKGAHDPRQIEAPKDGFASLLDRYGPALLENVAYVVCYTCLILKLTLSLSITLLS